MRLDTHKLTIAALLPLLLSAPCWATTVNRCDDGSGSLTFTTLGCPEGHALTQQNADNLPPGTLPTPSSSILDKPPTTKTQELVVVGQRDDGCGNVLSTDERRRAIINQQTPVGMTKRDVESLLGKPDKIISRNAEVRYVYEEKKGRSRQVSFDASGCVKGKR